MLTGACLYNSRQPAGSCAVIPRVRVESDRQNVAQLGATLPRVDYAKFIIV